MGLLDGMAIMQRDRLTAADGTEIGGLLTDREIEMRRAADRPSSDTEYRESYQPPHRMAFQKQ